MLHGFVQNQALLRRPPAFQGARMQHDIIIKAAAGVVLLSEP